MDCAIMDIVAKFIFNCLPAICSAICAILMVKQTIKINDYSINKDYRDTIFKDYLVRGIPLNREYIEFDKKNHKLVHTSKLTDILEKMRQDALFYKYFNEDFYTKLNNNIQKTIDYIMNQSNYTLEDEVVVLNNINNLITNLYDCISKNVNL